MSSREIIDAFCQLFSVTPKRLLLEELFGVVGITQFHKAFRGLSLDRSARHV